MPATRALVRPVSRSLGACELSFRPRQPIDVERAASQHRAYVAALAAAGLEVIALEELSDRPDAVFVEDPVVVLDEVAVLGRMGAESREAEVESVALAIARFRPLRRLPAEARLEGGDVLRVDHTLYVGSTARTNPAGAAALAAAVVPFGYEVVPVAVRGCLHLKSGATFAGGDGFLVNPDWVDAAAFRGHPIVAVPAEEPWAANTLTLGDRVLLPAGFPRTRDLLASRGLRVETVDVSELQKAEGSLTCLSVPFAAAQGAAAGR